MKTFYINKKVIISLLICSLFIVQLFAQRATVSMPLGVSVNSCGGGSGTFSYYNYNVNTNTLTDALIPAACTPRLRIGGSSFSYSPYGVSASYNPKDTNVYYLYTDYSFPLRTYVWKWPAGTCPTSTSPELDTIRSFAYDILGVTFTNDGLGYMLELGATAPYTAFLRSIDFVAGTYSDADTMVLSNGKKLYQSGSGDIAISPSGQMYFGINNKLFTPDYKDLGNPSKKIAATYIDTLITSSSNNELIALTYAQGELISSYSDGSNNCIYYEISPLVNNNIPIVATSTRQIYDAATIISGIGVAKSLVGYTLVSPGVYDLSYNILVKNMGTIPIRNVSVTDTLTSINPLGTISNVSTSFVTNPGGAFVLNGAFNGTTNHSLLTSTTTPLSNFPTSNNSIVIRVNCRVTNIIPGVVYFNRAFATATGFGGVSIRDTSTNGNNPDLNKNDIADNAYENRPTPFYVNTVVVSGPCSTLSNFVYNQNFGTGTGLAITLPNDPGKATPPHIGYTGSLTPPIALDTYTLTNDANNANVTDFINLTDATGNANGRMLVVNADAATRVFYRDTVSLCAGHEYSFATKAVYLPTPARTAFCISLGGVSYPRLKFQLRDVVTGIIIADTLSNFITSNSWNQYGFRFVMPSGFNNLVLEISNVGNGGCGNDLAIDDIQIGTCSPNPTLSITSGNNQCLGSSVTFTANVSSSGVIPGRKLYRVERSVNGFTGWTILSTSNSSTYTIASTTLTDINVYYRFILADSASGNMDNVNCRFTSPAVLLIGKILSTAPLGISKNKTNFCPGEPIRLIATGGTKGTGAVYQWYTVGCGIFLIGTGDTLNYTPLIATTVYVRLAGDCNNTVCSSIPITFSCDIDDDNDGIPDLVESLGVDVEKDSDYEGTSDLFDSNATGFVDINNDGVDDRYDADLDGIANQYDRDSDNDGIPDTVESFGVDSINGDGIIDNYTDTDGDGFSQNVDANNSGWNASGRGLNDIDLDGDGIPNFLDLDSDNDGIPDIVEAGGADTNNDGKLDGTFNDSSPVDGFHDSFDGNNCILRSGADINSDGRADRWPFDNMDNDRRPNPFDLDSDGDGVTDVIEMLYGQYVVSGTSLFWDTDLDGFVDGAINSKGWNTAIDAAVSYTIPNSDADARPDYLDIDSDNDGITDNIEAQTTHNTAYLLPTTTDADNDGLSDVYDNFLGQFKGGRLNPFNIDGDTRPDYLDTDTDNDGVTDLKEGNDYNRNGNYTDDTNNLTGNDNDTDGLDNRFDTLPNGPNVTARLLGNAGSFTGPAPGSYGTKARVWRINASQYDRDWRYKLALLDIINLKLEGTINNEIALLNWSYTKDFGFVTVNLERSNDGINFTTIYTKINNEHMPGNASLGYNDSWATLPNNKYYYRLRVTSADATERLSNIVVLKNNNNKLVKLDVYPNPAKNFTNINITALQKENSIITIVNTQGQIVWKQNLQLQIGNNTINLSNLNKWNTGMYVVKVQFANYVQTQKLFIQ